MESSIAVFLMRWSACELLPTNALSETATLHLLAFIHLGPRASVHRLKRFVGNNAQRASCLATRREGLQAHPCGRGNSAISDA